MLEARKQAPKNTVSLDIPIHHMEALRVLGNSGGGLLKKLSHATGVTLGLRGQTLHVQGLAEGVELARRVVDEVVRLLSAGRSSDDIRVERLVYELGDEAVEEQGALTEKLSHVVIASPSGRTVTARSLAQHRYVKAIETNDLTFGVGPAGTGKTYLAMAMAIRALLDKKIKRIVLTRPAVEAGEKLGFLPGDLAEKVNPYLRPLYDALYDMLDDERAQNLIQKGVVEVAPLAFMRGRTLNQAFVILDEAQNTTTEQMKMFLTRLGYDSKAVVNGDITQMDLPDRTPSGLVDAVNLLHGVQGIAIARFTHHDVVRHPLVQRIVQAYEARPAPQKT